MVFFDSRCNNLEKWQAERECSEKSVSKEILKVRAFSSETLLGHEKLMQNDDVVAFNITYYPIFKNIRNILDGLHILLAPEQNHEKLLANIPRTG